MSAALIDNSPARIFGETLSEAHIDIVAMTPSHQAVASETIPLFAADAVTPQTRVFDRLIESTTGKKSSPGQNIVISDSLWKGLNPSGAPNGIFSPQPVAGESSLLYSSLCNRLSQARLMRQLRAGNSPATRRTPKSQLVKRTVFLIRHAHASVNTEGHTLDIFDPSISELGLDQIRRMLAVFDDDPLCAPADEDDFLATTKGLPGPSVVLCSPLMRALQTATETFSNMLTRDAKRLPVPIVAVEELREVVGAGVTAELRHTTSELKKLFPTADLSLLKGDEDPYLAYAKGNGEKLPNLKERAAKVLHFLLHIEHEHDAEVPNGATIAVVSHFHLINCLVERVICSQGRNRSIDPTTFAEVFDEAAIAQQFDRVQQWQTSLKNCGIVAMDLELEDCGMRAKPRWKLWSAEFTPLSI